MMDDTIIFNVVNFSDECKTADGQSINVTKVGQVTLRATVNGTVQVVTLSEVYYAKYLVHNFARLKKKKSL